MTDPAIEAFFAERKEAWLKKNLEVGMTQDGLRDKNLECEEVFNLKNWLPNAAKRAGQISLSTHPVTFSHPSARKNKNGYASSIIFDTGFIADGFLRSGNVPVDPDALGNAAALDVYKFLTLVMQDGATLMQHLQSNSELAQKLLRSAADPADVKKGFLEMVAAKGDAITSSKIKQVYFPVEKETEGYHLLSVLSNSGHLFELRKRLDKLRFSEDIKARRELRRNNQYCAEGYQEIYNLTTIGYGGTKPQNISVQNNQNAGKAHLLLSVPPSLDVQYVRLPRRNFFSDMLYAKSLREIFQAFHRLVSADHNDISIRRGLDYRAEQYLDQLILKMWQARQGFTEQSHTRPEALPAYQKYWLFPENEQERSESSIWLDELVLEAARHFSASYKKILGTSALILGDDQMRRVTDVIEQNRETLL